MNEHIAREGFSSYYVVPRRGGYAYAERIISEQNCKMILPFEIRRVDDESCYYYQISGLLSLKKKMKGSRLERRDYQNVYQKIVRAVDEIESFLLPVEGIVLDSSVIFFDEDGDDLRFCYQPDSETDLVEQLRILTEELMEKMDFSDQDLVSYMYQIHEQLIKGVFPKTLILNEIEEKTEDAEPKAEETEQTVFPKEAILEISNQEMPAEQETEGRRTKKWYIETGICVGVSVIFAALAVFYIVTGILYGWSGNGIRMLSAAVLLLIVNTVLLIRRNMKKMVFDEQTTLFIP